MNGILPTQTIRSGLAVRGQFAMGRVGGASAMWGRSARSNITLPTIMERGLTFSSASLEAAAREERAFRRKQGPNSIETFLA